MPLLTCQCHLTVWYEFDSLNTLHGDVRTRRPSRRRAGRGRGGDRRPDAGSAIGIRPRRRGPGRPTRPSSSQCLRSWLFSARSHSAGCVALHATDCDCVNANRDSRYTPRYCRDRTTYTSAESRSIGLYSPVSHAALELERHSYRRGGDAHRPARVRVPGTRGSRLYVALPSTHCRPQDPKTFSSHSAPRARQCSRVTLVTTVVRAPLALSLLLAVLMPRRIVLHPPR